MPSLGPQPFLSLSSAAYILLSIGHTQKGLDQFSHPSLASLPTGLRGASKIGWYEGSVWFVIASVLNYKWSQTGLVDMADKTMAGLLVTLMLGASVSYWRVNVKPPAAALFVVGVLQAVGMKQAIA